MEAIGQILHWSGRVLSAEDLRRSLNGHQELVLPARTIITPLAAEALRSNNIRVRRQSSDPPPAAKAIWGYAQERPDAVVASAVGALRRDGVDLKELQIAQPGAAWNWALAVAKCIEAGDCQGGVVFCHDAGLVCCVANKLAGLRAVAVASVAQAARAALGIGANLIIMEMPGPTFFELRQLLRTICSSGAPACPPGVACTLGELDHHAHR